MNNRVSSIAPSPATGGDAGLTLGRTRVGPIPGKGLGLIAAEPIGSGELIEENRCLPLGVADSAAVQTTLLRHYVYFWADDSGADELALAMGNLSFCNHSARPNATIALDRQRRIVALRASQPIEAGTEVTIDYEYALDFTVQE